MDNNAYKDWYEEMIEHQRASEELGKMQQKLTIAGIVGFTIGVLVETLFLSRKEN